MNKKEDYDNFDLALGCAVFFLVVLVLMCLVFMPC
jgi:hypothetical protein